MNGNTQEEKHDQLDELGTEKYYVQSGRSAPSKRYAIALKNRERSTQRQPNYRVNQRTLPDRPITSLKYQSLTLAQRQLGP
jgi:hypothetical protein